MGNIFRGKRVDIDEWIVGYSSKGRLYGYKGGTLQPCIERDDKGVMISSVVFGESVGQHIGAFDNHNKMVFVGDILERRYNDGKYVERCVVECVRDKSGDRFVFNGFNSDLDIDISRCEVIGNTYDNPDLSYGGGK